MSSDPVHAAAPPSIFLSYASEDRLAARKLRDTLAQAGLEVWLDEEELAGGEAWDSKIRQQIRTCTYFMPLVSATTEARREGYFRREWRFAIERTLDLADDVTFLVPVVIDETPEQNSRVPEKFLTVQWLRCPGGIETPVLRALATRLVAEHREAHTPVPPRLFAPASGTRPATAPDRPMTRAEQRAAKREARREAPPPPFPSFPPFPVTGHRSRFVYDLVLWAGHMIVAFWWRLPRWLRYVATIVIVVKLIGFVFTVGSPPPNNRDNNPRRSPTAEKVDAALALKEAAGSGSSDTALKILHATAAALDSLQSGRPLAVVIFSAADPTVKEAALKSFGGVRDELRQAGHESDVAIGVIPFTSDATDNDILARAAALKCRWLLVGEARPETDDEFTLTVKLYETAGRKIVWQADRRGDRDAAAEVGHTLAHSLLGQISFDPAPPAATPPPAPQP